MKRGIKRKDSDGNGLGGAWIKKMVVAHNAEFEILSEDRTNADTETNAPAHFRFKFRLGGEQ